ncbi:MAG TPA: tetratricopeptide repeat protein [Bacteroidales bacterium]|nr:tetratricopeptide repeat protein [Bacteroidales bacterium]
MAKATAVKKQSLRTDKDRMTRIIFLFVIVAFTFLLYGNTLKNTYSLDDYIIQGQNSQLVKEGINSIGDIFTSTYTSRSTAEGLEKSYGYRPLVRVIYALEYSIFGVNPRVAHLINVLLYLTLVLVLYRLLQRILRDYSIWFPFIITLLFIAHPIHTEVVASLKNRDEILSMLFSLITLQMIIKYADRNKIIFLVIGALTYILAFLAKPTALTFWFVFPLTLYFFTEMPWKKIGIIWGVLTLMIIIGGMAPFWFLDRVRDYSMIENPLYFEDSIWNILGTGMYSLGYYIRLLVVPHPLLYYYGYDMIPVVNLGNIWVLLSILFHLGILLYAVWKFKEKHILSYAIFFYLFTIAMFSNIVRPAPGIIAERFLLVPSLGFVIILAWAIFKIFKANPENKVNFPLRIFFVVILTAVILGPYSYKTINRNKRWYSDTSLYRADMKYLDNSVKAHDLMGTSIMRMVERELAKPVNVTKFLMPDIENAIQHFKRAVEIWPGHTSSWVNLGMIYNNPRIAEHLMASGDTAKGLSFKRNAVNRFKEALALESDNGKALFNLGLTYEYVGDVDSAAYYYERCIENNPDIINPRSRLADIRFRQGYEQEAIRLNMEIVRKFPNEALPYVSFGNYYMFKGDTLKAIENYEEAAKRNTRPEVFAFLSDYFLNNGNGEKAKYYQNKYLEATNSR